MITVDCGRRNNNTSISILLAPNFHPPHQFIISSHILIQSPDDDNRNKALKLKEQLLLL